MAVASTAATTSEPHQTAAPNAGQFRRRSKLFRAESLPRYVCWDSGINRMSAGSLLSCGAPAAGVHDVSVWQLHGNPLPRRADRPHLTQGRAACGICEQFRDCSLSERLLGVKQHSVHAVMQRTQISPVSLQSERTMPNSLEGIDGIDDL